MPIYEYACQSCGEHFDKLIRSISRIPPEIICPACQSKEVQRIISTPAIHTGRAGSESASTDAHDTTPANPPVFGRKELQAAQEKKRQLRESVIHGED